jgi:hypothetical protein
MRELPVAMTKLPPSLLPKEQFAAVLGAPVSQIREWAARGVIKPVERAQGNAGAYLFGRDDLTLGAVVLALQRVLGEKSPVVFELASQIRARVGAWAKWNEIPRGPLPLLLTQDGAAVLVIVSPRVIADVLSRLHELS